MLSGIVISVNALLSSGSIFIQPLIASNFPFSYKQHTLRPAHHYYTGKESLSAIILALLMVGFCTVYRKFVSISTPLLSIIMSSKLTYDEQFMVSRFLQDLILYLDNVVVVSSCKSFIRSNDNGSYLSFSLLESLPTSKYRCSIQEYASGFWKSLPEVRKSTALNLSAFSCLSHLGRRDHIHGVRDLHRIFYAVEFESVFL